MIKSISDIRQSVEALRDQGSQRGDNTGFSCLDSLYSIKPGTFTIVQGAPTHGKSELIFEFLISQAEHFNKKSIILSPESGSAEDITMELIHKFLKKSAYKSNPYACDDREFHKGLNWVEYYFSIADDEEKSYSFVELADEIAEYEKTHKTRYDFVMAEPWNELNHKMALNDNSGRQDLAIEDELTFLRRYCKNEKKHVFLSFHPSFQTLIQDPVSKKRYYEMPRAREAAGGQATLRKAFSWINIWRPPVGVCDEHGMPYEENQLLVQIEKSKPKGIGAKGQTTLFFDWKQNRYYEHFNGQNSYAFEHENAVVIDSPSAAITPSELFNISTSESPF